MIIVPTIQDVADLAGVTVTTVVKYCLKNRIRIPDELRVVGYDDTLFASLCPIPLTTIHQPVAEVAEYAVDSVIRRSDGENVEEGRVFPVSLTVRETT